MSDKTNASRRDFLKGTTVAAGVAVAGQIPIARMAHAAGSDVIKAVLIGCGGRGNGAVENSLDADPGIKVIAVADAFEEKAQGTAKRLREKRADRVDLPDDRVFSGLDAFDKAIAAGADLIITATPPGFRPMIYAAAIAAGKHVFMEKPCCVDAPGYKKLMEANQMAEEKGLKVGVGFQRRHTPQYVETIKRIHDGAIGNLTLLRAYWNGGGIWNRPRKEGATEMEYQVDNWYHFCWLCGDHICEQHIHNLDIANWVYNKSGDPKTAHPVEANGMGGRQVRKGKDVGQIYDHHFVEFTYADGSKVFSQCRHIPNTWSPVMEHAHGTKGDSNCCGQISGETKWSYKGDNPNPYDQEHVDLVKAIRAGDKYNEGWFGAASSFTSVLGRMATYSGQIVKWDEAVEKGPDEMPKAFAWDTEPPVKPGPDGGYEHAVAVPGVYKAY